MKRCFILLFTFLVAVVACNKEKSEQVGEEIVISCATNVGFEAGAETKAAMAKTALTTYTSFPNATSLHWGAYDSGHSAVKWADASATVSSSKINTGYYQTNPATSYTYYVCNQSMSIGASTTTSAVNTTDVIAGTATSSSGTPSVTLNHIFAAIGSLSCSGPGDGYSISVTGWQIKGNASNTGTAGTYNITSGTWSSTTALSSFTDISAGPSSVSVGGSASNTLLIPGDYTIKCFFTLSKGDFSATYEKTANITLAAGQINNISAATTIKDAVDIKVTVSLTDWRTNSINLSSWN